MRDSCGTCLLLAEKFHCGWCEAKQTCEIFEECSAEWLDRSKTCPKPRITTFEPHTGPWEGGTNITIRGSDLGKKFSDIDVTLHAEGTRTPCLPFADLYIATKKIVCTVFKKGALYSYNGQRGRITVRIANHYLVESAAEYQFVDPQIADFQPRSGPISGGTKIRISGKHLNAGSELKAFVSDRPCRILSVNENVTICKTSPVSAPVSGKLQMYFDNNVRVAELESFQYLPDPTIITAASGPNTGDGKTIRAIPAGGIKITVVGSQFEALRNPVLYVYLGEKEYSSVCNVISDAKLECDSPKIEMENLIIDADEPATLEFDFKQDGWAGVTQVPTKFYMYPNPVYYSFQDNVKYLTGDQLTIYGKDLDLVCTEDDVLVQIGDSPCNITLLTRGQLTCHLPLAADSNE